MHHYLQTIENGGGKICLPIKKKYRWEKFLKKYQEIEAIFKTRGFAKKSGKSVRTPAPPPPQPKIEQRRDHAGDDRIGIKQRQEQPGYGPPRGWTRGQTSF